ncbi:hypothetical protein F5050DRAFT_198932 [Lentinula boryana]|uniref:Prephenate dehydratase domain-containing protein n=1 Tax=Lentinula boryana TaxID=40481 RepID=A0ABQ8QR73_9AGAR|nr:hypothetical protein F5050DRAFT_198932 [Lentinula boryana]
MKVRVGFLGPLGTYTHQAAHEYFQDSVIYNERKTIAGTLSDVANFTVPKRIALQKHLNLSKPLIMLLFPEKTPFLALLSKHLMALKS